MVAGLQSGRLSGAAGPARAAADRVRRRGLRWLEAAGQLAEPVDPLAGRIGPGDLAKRWAFGEPTQPSAGDLDDRPGACRKDQSFVRYAEAGGEGVAEYNNYYNRLQPVSTCAILAAWQTGLSVAKRYSESKGG